MANNRIGGPVLREQLHIVAASGGRGSVALASALKFSMSSVGYTEKEFILTGSAASYASQESNSLGVDGKWAVEKNDSAAYTTRAIVYRPIDEAEFNGTVIVEWMNVTSGSDSSPVWIYTHNELIREGYVNRPGFRGGCLV